MTSFLYTKSDKKGEYMEKLKKIGLKLLYPHILVLILLILISIGLLISMKDMYIILQRETEKALVID